MDMQRARGPRLPQELFDHIIDLIACKAGDSDVKKKLTALRACSLVSKPFNLTCRKHCFSEIILYADGSVQKRSKRLLNVLLNVGNGGLVQYIRIFRIIISSQPLPQDISKLAPVTRRQRAASHLKRFGRKVGLWTNYLVDVLNVITGAPLHQLTIGTWRGMLPLDWGNFSDGFIAPLLAMRVRQSLKILRLYNILNLDESFVLKGAPTATLDALYLSNVGFKRSASFALSPFDMGSLSRVQHLEFSPTPRFCKSALIREMMVRPAHTFSNVWSLVIPFPEGPAVLKLFCKLVKSFSSTLLDLEIRNFPGGLEIHPNIQTFSGAVSHLARLWTLRLVGDKERQRIAYPVCVLRNIALCLYCIFLPSQGRQPPIVRLSIEFNIFGGSDSEPTYDMPFYGVTLMAALGDVEGVLIRIYYLQKVVMKVKYVACLACRDAKERCRRHIRKEELSVEEAYRNFIPKFEAIIQGFWPLVHSSSIAVEHSIELLEA